MNADVIIIGAGIHGVSLAFHLAKKDVFKKIVVLERSHLGAGATGKSAVLVGTTNYTSAEEVALAVESLAYFQHWYDLVGGDCRYRPTGSLYFLAKHHDQLQTEVTWRRQLKVSIRLLAARDALLLDPALLIEDVSHVLYEPEAGYVDPTSTLFSFATASHYLGVQFYQGITATRILVQGERVTGVETTNGTFEAPIVCVTVGAWINELFTELGIDTAVTTKQSCAVVFCWPYERTPKHLVYVDRINQFWARPIDGNHTLTGTKVGIKSQASHAFASQESVGQEYIDQCRKQLSRRFPVMQRCTARGNWACVVAQLPDNRPIIGAIPQYEGLFCVGDSGNSLKFSPAIGKSLAELITTSSSTIDLSIFRATRFGHSKTSPAC